jgi:hypothetical protein
LPPCPISEKAPGLSRRPAEQHHGIEQRGVQVDRQPLDHRLGQERDLWRHATADGTKGPRRPSNAVPSFIGDSAGVVFLHFVNRSSICGVVRLKFDAISFWNWADDDA